MTVSVVLAIAGVVVLLVGVVGGGIKAREIEIPSVPPIGRVIASIAGIVLIGISIWLSSQQNQLTSPPTLLPITPFVDETHITPTEGIPTPDPTKIYLIRSVLSQKVLGIDGTSIIQSEWISETYQEWIFEPLTGVDEGYYLIHSAQNGDCIDVRYATLDDGGEIVLYGCTGTDNQKWRIIATNSDAVYLEAKHSKKVMDLPNSSKDNGIRIAQYSFHGDKNQQWILTVVTPQ